MRPRDLLLLAGATVLFASAGFVLYGEPSAAGEQRPPAAVEVPATEPESRTPLPPPVAVDGGPVAPSAAGVIDPVYHRESRDTSGWTSGEIKGDIQLTASVVNRIQSIQVVVDELKNLDSPDGKRPFRRVVPVERGIGTPIFVVRDVPFSAYGYVVRVHSPGLNGSRQTVAITAESPYVDDVKLAITPGVPFSLLLRDQDLGPVALAEVRMVPVGEPLGRPLCDSRTDNFGSAVFENVLAGDYQVLIGPAGQPLIEPPIVTVQAGGRLFRGNVVQAQGQTITVPRGVPLTVAVTDAVGYPVEGAVVRVQATDRVKLLRLEGKTDFQGHAEFPRMLAGVWEIDVVKQDYQRRTSQITINDKEPPPEMQFQLARLR